MIYIITELYNSMDKDKLRTLYVEKDLSTHAVARQLGCSQTNVRYWLKKLGISKNKRNIVDDPTGPRACTNCKVVKETTEFYYQSYKNGSKGRFGSWCKQCMNSQVVERQRKYKQLAIDYKGGKCQLCGYDKYPGALEFHHLDPTKKDVEASKFSRNPLEGAQREELDKCVLLCSNCHREVHGNVVMAPQVGLEPTTTSLTEKRSTY